MKFKPTKDKYELLFHGFYLLYDMAAKPAQINEISSLIMVLLMDPNITQEHARIASDRAIEAHLNENSLNELLNLQIGGNF